MRLVGATQGYVVGAVSLCSHRHAGRRQDLPIPLATRVLVCGVSTSSLPLNQVVRHHRYALRGRGRAFVRLRTPFSAVSIATTESPSCRTVGGRPPRIRIGGPLPLGAADSVVTIILEAATAVSAGRAQVSSYAPRLVLSLARILLNSRRRQPPSPMQGSINSCEVQHPSARPLR